MIVQCHTCMHAMIAHLLLLCVYLLENISYRKAWKEYFEAEGSIKVAFWSALAEQHSQENACMSHSDSASESATDVEEGEPTAELSSRAATSDDASALCVSCDTSSDTCSLLTRDELIQQFLSISPVPEGKVTTVGMVRLFENIC